MGGEEKGVRVSRRKGDTKFPEATTARFPSGTLELIDGILEENESSSDFIRKAVLNEIRKRLRERRLERKKIEKRGDAYS